MVGHLARAESGYQRALGWDATLTVPGRAPQQAQRVVGHPSARREARDVAVDLLLDRARESDRGERLRRADRAVEAVGALLQPAEGRVQREPQRTGGRGAWRGRVFEPRASTHRFSVPRLHLWVRGHVCAARGVPRSSDSLSRKLENSRAQPYSHGRRLFMPCGRARASAAVRLGQAMPGAPLCTAAPLRAPRVAPFRKLRMADAWFTTLAEACSTGSFRTATAQSPSGASVDGASDALETFDLRKVRREQQEDVGSPVRADRRKVARFCVGSRRAQFATRPAVSAPTSVNGAVRNRTRVWRA